MGFFSNFFSRKNKIKKVVEEAVSSRFVEFEERLREIFQDSFLTKLDSLEPISQGFKAQNEDSLVKSGQIINNSITLYLRDGDIIYGEGDSATYNRAKAAKSKEEIMEILIPGWKEKEDERKKREKIEADRAAKEKEVNERLERIAQEEKKKDEERWDYCQQLIETTNEFEIVDNELRMIGIPLSMPKLLIDKFVALIKGIYDEDDDSKSEQYDAEYEALKNFWMWCALNPNAHARNDLFKFLSNHDMRINKNGFFFTYRRVVKKEDIKEEDVKFNEFVSEAYLKIKTKWKKKPSNFTIVQKDGVFSFVETTKLKSDAGFSHGTVQDLYESISTTSEAAYTDARTHSFDIRIGKEVRIDRSECDENHAVECSKGLMCSPAA